MSRPEIHLYTASTDPGSFRTELRLDPKDRIDFMVEVIQRSHQEFRNVFPERFVEEVKQSQAGLCTKDV